MDLEIILSMKGDVPIYEQIEARIKEQILDGTLPAGASIPSMRALARMLKVSVITVQKAYENLKREGYIDTVVGRGTVVAADGRQVVMAQKQSQLRACLGEAVELGKALGLSLDELKKQLDEMGEE